MYLVLELNDLIKAEDQAYQIEFNCTNAMDQNRNSENSYGKMWH